MSTKTIKENHGKIKQRKEYYMSTSVSAQLKLRLTLLITPTNQKRAPARGLTNHKR